MVYTHGSIKSRNWINRKVLTEQAMKGFIFFFYKLSVPVEQGFYCILFYAYQSRHTMTIDPHISRILMAISLLCLCWVTRKL